jgi:nucleotide-binding universal stress UspA family protein
MGRDGRHRIVVGVEGSAGSHAALRWAIEEARLRNGVVEVVTAYLPTYVPAAPDFGYVPLDPVDLVDEVTKMQDEVIATVSDTVDTAGVRIEQKLLKGRAADTLIAAAEGADMLIVGNRGRGGFRGLLLGSVSQQIAHHATCPVVIVRADMDLDDPDAYR